MPVMKRPVKKAKKKRPKKKRVPGKAKKKAPAAKGKNGQPGHVTRILKASRAMLDPQAWQHGRQLYGELKEEKKKTKKAA
jgi:hypothetical protein